MANERGRVPLGGAASKVQSNSRQFDYFSPGDPGSASPVLCTFTGAWPTASLVHELTCEV